MFIRKNKIRIIILQPVDGTTDGATRRVTCPASVYNHSDKLFLHVKTIKCVFCTENELNVIRRPGAKTIKKNTNSTQNKSETHRAKQYEVTSFLSTDCELSTETCWVIPCQINQWFASHPSDFDEIWHTCR